MHKIRWRSLVTKDVPRDKAFSLLEMLMVISIIAVLGILTLPKLTELVRQTEEKTLIAQLQHLIHQAADETIIRHTPIALQLITLVEYQQIRIFANNQQDGILHNEQDIIRQIEVPHHGRLHARFYPRYRDFLLFFPFANLNNDNGSFWFCRKAEKQPAFILTVNNAAETRILYARAHHPSKLIC